MVNSAIISEFGPLDATKSLRSLTLSPENGNHFVNGAYASIAITTHGSDWYYVCLIAL